MTVESRGLGYGLFVVAALAAPACTTNDDAGGVDAPPPPPEVTYDQDLATNAWSMASVNGRTQIAISDIRGATSCAASSDQRNTIGAEGGQIIIQLPDPTSEVCPQGNYTLKKCSNAPGTDALVPAGCAFFRKFDASGAALGSTPSLTGTVKISGTATACTLLVQVGFLGRAFNSSATLNNGATAQPWCFER